ncbi:MAG: hypothetical protein RLZ55_1375 [Actinomycetota bacterium]|jgi:Uma2 family endonuclease
MTTMVTARLLTRDDLRALPDDGLRHELIDGQFVMTPAPGSNHQTISLTLAAMIRAQVLGSDLKVLTAPFDVALGPHVVEPDIVLARKADFTARDLPVAPLLVIEVLSPSTSHLDQGRKRDLYAEAGVPHYWIVDPETPSITTLTLTDGAYAQTAHVSRDEPLISHDPIALNLSPAELLRD